MNKVVLCIRDYFGPNNGKLYFKVTGKYTITTIKTDYGVSSSITFEKDAESGYGPSMLVHPNIKEFCEIHGLVNLAVFREKRINSILCD